jgi:hypothetical protein
MGRVAPRPDVIVDNDAQLDRSPRAAASSRAGHIEQTLDQCASLGRARPALQDDEDVEVAGRPQATKHRRAMQVRAEHIAAEHVVYELQDALYLPGLRRVQHFTTTRAMPPAQRVANTRKLWETASMGFDTDCACSCRRAGLALFQSRSSNAHGAVRT